MAVISIGSRLSHAARPVLKLESPWINQLVNQSGQKEACDELYHRSRSFAHTHTHTHMDLCPAILCSPRANSGLIAEAVRSHQGAIKFP